MNDEILDRIYAIRERIAEECGHDFKKLGERYKRLQENCRPELLVTAKVPRTDPESLLPPGESAPDEDEFEDEIVREVHATRRKIMEDCGNDLNTLFERLKRRQDEHPEKLAANIPRTQPEANAGQ